MALVALDQLLYIRQRVRLPLSVRSPISPRFASELAHASQRQELLEPREARDDVAVQMSSNAIVDIAAELLLRLAP